MIGKVLTDQFLFRQWQISLVVVAKLLIWAIMDSKQPTSNQARIDPHDCSHISTILG